MDPQDSEVEQDVDESTTAADMVEASSKASDSHRPYLGPTADNLGSNKDEEQQVVSMPPPCRVTRVSSRFTCDVILYSNAYA